MIITFITATSSTLPRLSLQDPAWGQRWKQSLMLLIAYIAAPDRNDPMFPFLRCLASWAGHSWASGHARFGDGNNIESSSEAINAWFGIFLLGEALHDQQLRELARGCWPSKLPPSMNTGSMSMMTCLPIPGPYRLSPWCGAEKCQRDTGSRTDS
ncbi:MAG UNVERIFIED_CONTAM: hypothetical protein LVR18_25110 [Planctomycetaceae bacterium]|jgi:hypothetical protein